LDIYKVWQLSSKTLAKKELSIRKYKIVLFPFKATPPTGMHLLNRLKVLEVGK
jgi:hypothetical protein